MHPWPDYVWSVEIAYVVQRTHMSAVVWMCHRVGVLQWETIGLPREPGCQGTDHLSSSMALMINKKMSFFSLNQHGYNCMRQKWISCRSLALWRGFGNPVQEFFFFSHRSVCPFTTMRLYGRPAQMLCGPDQSGWAFVIIITKHSKKTPI